MNHFVDEFLDIIGQEYQSMKTLKLSTSTSSNESISSAADFLASQLVLQENNLSKKTQDGSGLNTSEPFAYYDQALSSWKMFQGSLFTDSETFSEVWPRSDIMLNGIVYQQQPLVPHIDGTESGLLPTPESTGSQGRESGSRLQKQSRGGSRQSPRAIPYAIFSRLERHDFSQMENKREGRQYCNLARSDWWSIEPDVDRMAHGLPGQVDRLKALGNAVVPQIPEWIGRRILKVIGR